MEYMNQITVETIVKAPVEKVWEYWNNPEYITGWAFASNDWECPHAENDLKTGGRFLTRMAAKDGSMSFDLVGTYTQVEDYKLINYIMDDIEAIPGQTGRKVSVVFEPLDEHTTKVTETFDPETINPEDMQRAGWQAILENFKKCVEIN
jgi:uncharacterized protein YndB with AHSA1/START domain